MHQISTVSAILFILVTCCPLLIISQCDTSTDCDVCTSQACTNYCRTSPTYSCTNNEASCSCSAGLYQEFEYYDYTQAGCGDSVKSRGRISGSSQSKYIKTCL